MNSTHEKTPCRNFLYSGRKSADHHGLCENSYDFYIILHVREKGKVAEKGAAERLRVQKVQRVVAPCTGANFKEGRGSAAGCAEKLHNLPPMTHSAEKLLSGKR